MQNGYFQSKVLTRDYKSVFSMNLPALDVMVARRSWRKYTNWQMEPDLQSDFEAFISRSAVIRECRQSNLILVADSSRMDHLFKIAYKGLIGKVNPWLPKSKASGMLVLAIDKNARGGDRPLDYVYPTLVGQDAVLWLTEKGLGTVWLAGVNGPELARALDLPPEKWIFAVIVFGKTGVKPTGLNYDNLSYRMISRKRKKLTQISHLNRIGDDFPLDKTESIKLSVPFHDISDALQMLEKRENFSSGPPIRMIELELMIESARIAPSACNKQPWQFVAINDEKLLRQMAGFLDEENVPKGMVACLGEAGTLYEVGMERPFWLIDVPIAMANMSLMAGALGHAVSVYLDIPEDIINKRLGLKSNWRTAGVIGLK